MKTNWANIRSIAGHYYDVDVEQSWGGSGSTWRVTATHIEDGTTYHWIYRGRTARNRAMRTAEFMASRYPEVPHRTSFISSGWSSCDPSFLCWRGKDKCWHPARCKKDGGEVAL